AQVRAGCFGQLQKSHDDLGMPAGDIRCLADVFVEVKERLFDSLDEVPVPAGDAAKTGELHRFRLEILEVGRLAVFAGRLSGREILMSQMQLPRSTANSLKLVACVVVKCL